MKSINAEDKLLKLFYEELSKRIDVKIINNIRNMVVSKSCKRKNSVENIYKKDYSL